MNTRTSKILVWHFLLYSEYLQEKTGITICMILWILRTVNSKLIVSVSLLHFTLSVLFLYVAM